MNFFENYYTVFDKENRRVGFTLSKTAVPRLAEVVTNEESTSLFSARNIDENWKTVSPACGGGLVAAVLLYYSFRQSQKKDQFARSI